MAMRNFVLVAISIASLLIGPNVGLHMEITPDSGNGTTHVIQLTMSCRLDAGDYNTTSAVLLMSIVKDDNDSIAIVRENSGLYQRPGQSSNLNAEGQIDIDHPHDSYLQVTIDFPDPTNDGHYTCKMYYLDPSQHVNNEEVTVNITMGKPTKTNLGLDISYLLQKLAILKEHAKNMGKKDDGDIYKRVAELEAKTHNQSQALNGLANADEEIQEKFVDVKRNITAVPEGPPSMASVLSERITKLQAAFTELVTLSNKVLDDYDVTYYTLGMVERHLKQKVMDMSKAKARNTNKTQCAFSASRTREAQIHERVPIVFDKVLMREGQGFDEKTGIFTAPKDGIYVFFFVLRVNCDDCQAQFVIMANDEIARQLSVGSQTGFNQGCISATLELKAGAKVLTVALANVENSLSNKAWMEKSSLFSGYLLA